MTATLPVRLHSDRDNDAQPTAEAKSFAELGLSKDFCDALHAAGYDRPFPIQAQAIPHVLRGGDLLGCARTGTGKTAAFALPLLQLMLERGRQGKHPRIRTLVLAPTRELAAQIGASFERYAGRSGLRSLVIFGGVGKQPQVSALRRGVDILVATPGRLLDLYDQGAIQFDHVEHLVLDEADRMLDMGFIHDVKRILRTLPEDRQNLMFSATMPTEIRSLANKILYKPTKVAVDPVSSTAKPVSQSVYKVRQSHKTSLLIHLLTTRKMEAVLVFTRTKHGADKVVKKLRGAGIEAAAIHGNKSQNARERALQGIKDGSVRVLVATDIAARGIDVKGLTHVINFELPNIAESYVHRIGRTGRAGALGEAIALCSEDEYPFLAAIEKLTKTRMQKLDLPTFEIVAESPKAAAPGGRGRPGPSRAPRGARRPARDGDRQETGAPRGRTGATRKKATRAPGNRRPKSGAPASGPKRASRRSPGPGRVGR